MVPCGGGGKAAASCIPEEHPTPQDNPGGSAHRQATPLQATPPHYVSHWRACASIGLLGGSPRHRATQEAPPTARPRPSEDHTLLISALIGERVRQSNCWAGASPAVPAPWSARPRAVSESGRRRVFGLCHASRVCSTHTPAAKSRHGGTQEPSDGSGAASSCSCCRWA